MLNLETLLSFLTYDVLHVKIYRYLLFNSQKDLVFEMYNCNIILNHIGII